MVQEVHVLTDAKPAAPFVDDHLAQSLEDLCRVCHLDMGLVWYVDSDRRVLRWVEPWVNVLDPWHEALCYGRSRTCALGRGVAGKAWEDRHPVWIADVANEPTYSRALPSGSLGAIAFPVIYQESVIAILELVGHVLHAPSENFLSQIKACSDRMVPDIIDRFLKISNVRQPVQEHPVCIQKGLAHDLNNILAVISGLTDMGLVGMPSSNKLVGYFSQIQVAVARGQHLVQQILDAASPGVQEWKSLALGPVIREVLGYIRVGLTSNIVIQDHLLAFGVPIKGHVQELHRVVMNLCVNAIQAMDEHGTLTVTLEEVEWETVGLDGGKIQGSDKSALSTKTGLDGSCLRLTVCDTGVGMSQEIQEHIFDPFFTTKDEAGGKGLGLAISRQIVFDHGGVFSVKSTPGLGTKISVFLPCDSLGLSDMDKESTRPIV